MDISRNKQFINEEKKGKELGEKKEEEEGIEGVKQREKDIEREKEKSYGFH